MGNCNSAKKRDLQKAKSLQAAQAAKSPKTPAASAKTTHTSALIANASLEGDAPQISSSYTDRKLKEKEMFKNIIERTQQKLIDVSQSPGGILDWSDEPENETSTQNISKLKQRPHTHLCKQIFDLDCIQKSTVEALANMELIRPEEIDMMVSAMSLQEAKLNSLALENVGDLVIRLEVAE